MIKLTITEKGGQPRSLTFDKDEISIGRVSGNDIVLPKGNISKRHSRLTSSNGVIELFDLKSTNGTYLNGRKIAESATIAGSDRIQVGDFLITLDDGGAEGGRSAARALPVPPPPPPPARGGSGLSGLPPVPSSNADNLDAGQAGKSRSGRIPIPPPPPPPRRATGPTSPMALEGDDVDIDGDLAPPAPSDVTGGSDELGAGSGPALFEGARNTAYDDASRPMNVEAAIALVEGQEAAAVEPASPEPPADAGMTGPVGEEAAAEGQAPLDPLEALLVDAAVTQIIISGPESAWVERNGKLEAVEGGLGDDNAVAEALWRLANTAVPPPPPDNPVVDVRLPDGTRVSAVFPPAAVVGVCGSIRRAALPVQSLAELAAAGGLSREAQTLIEAALGAQRNLLVTGDASSISPLLGAVAAAIPAGRRVVSLGAGAGQPSANWTELAPVGDLAALIRVATTLRADHLLVGEVVGPEVLDLLMAASHGQEGMIIGLTARSAAEALARLEALGAQAPGAQGIASLANSTLDLVMHVAALTDGSLRVAEITEVKLDSTGHLAVDPIMSWRGEGSRRGPAGKMQVNGVSSRLAAAMAAGGGALPSNLIRK